MLLLCNLVSRFAYGRGECVRSTVAGVCKVGSQDVVLHGSLGYQTFGFRQVIHKCAASFKQ